MVIKPRCDIRVKECIKLFGSYDFAIEVFHVSLKYYLVITIINGWFIFSVGLLGQYVD